MNEKFRFILDNGDIAITITASNIAAVHFIEDEMSADVYLYEPDNYTICIPTAELSRFKQFLNKHWHGHNE